MGKEKKVSPAKQKIIANYEMQKQLFQKEGYTEKTEIISVAKANIMAFVIAGPIAVLCLVIWLFTRKSDSFSFYTGSLLWFMVLFFLTIFIHEVLHGIGWSLYTKDGFKSIYLGVMWEYLTPYCHCKEPLTPRKYMVGGMLPFVVLGLGLYVISLFTGSGLLLILGICNILSAGGDLTLMLMLGKYLKRNDAYILDHPTDCGFIAFQQS